MAELELSLLCADRVTISFPNQRQKWQRNYLTFSFFMLENSYLHQNGMELNFLLIGMASEPAISFRINPRIRKDSKGVFLTGYWQKNQ